LIRENHASGQEIKQVVQQSSFLFVLSRRRLASNPIHERNRSDATSRRAAPATVSDIGAWNHSEKLFSAKLESFRKESLRKESLRKESLRKESLRKESLRKESLRKESLRKESLRKESLRKEKLRNTFGFNRNLPDIGDSQTPPEL
jgi:hypothetical protein